MALENQASSDRAGYRIPVQITESGHVDLARMRWFTASEVGAAISLKSIWRTPDRRRLWLWPQAALRIGFHDGSFTIYRDGAPASAALERLAEDANAGPISNRFNQAGGGISQGIAFGSNDILNNIFPGSSASAKVLLDCSLTNSHYFSYAAMIVPSNDAFI